MVAPTNIAGHCMIVRIVMVCCCRTKERMLELENHRVKVPVLRSIARRVMMMRWTAGGPIFWYGRLDCNFLVCCRRCLICAACAVSLALTFFCCYFSNCGGRSIVRAGTEVIVRQGHCPYSRPTVTDDDIRSAIVGSTQKSEYSSASEAQVRSQILLERGG